jgi:hypothetical protein
LGEAVCGKDTLRNVLGFLSRLSPRNESRGMGRTEASLAAFAIRLNKMGLSALVSDMPLA